MGTDINQLVRFQGVAFIDRGLENGDELHITITNDAGEEIGNGIGTVTARTHRPRRDGEGDELIHSVKVT